MASISEAILFISSASQASVPCVKLVVQNNLPINILKLDSTEDRQKAASGKYFQVTAVPTLVVVYGNGTTQLFLGTQKVIEWITMMVRHASAAGRPQGGVTPTPGTIVGGNMYDRAYGGSGEPAPRPRPRVVEEDDPDPEGPQVDEEEDIPEPPRAPRPVPRAASAAPRPRPKPRVVEEDDPEEEGSEPAPMVCAIRPKGKAPKASAKAKSKKKRGVKFNLPEDGEPQTQVPVATAPTPQKKPSARMASLFDMAKKMEADRQGTLGYKEEDLPKYT